MKSETLLEALECHSHMRVEGPVMYRACENGFEFYVSADAAAYKAMRYIEALENALACAGARIPPVPAD